MLLGWLAQQHIYIHGLPDSLLFHYPPAFAVCLACWLSRQLFSDLSNLTMPHLLRLPMLVVLSTWYLPPSAMNRQVGSYLFPDASPSASVWKEFIFLDLSLQCSLVFASTVFFGQSGHVAMGMKAPEGSPENRKCRPRTYTCMNACQPANRITHVGILYFKHIKPRAF